MYWIGEENEIKFPPQFFLIHTGDIIRPKDRHFTTCHSRIRENSKFWPHFKDCIDATDGTHIRVTVPSNEQPKYFGIANTLQTYNQQFPHPTEGKYNLVDLEYPNNRKGF